MGRQGSIWARSLAAAALAAFLLTCAPPHTTPTPSSLHPTLAPSTRITLSAVTPDGALWYTYDDAQGGIGWGQQTTGLYRLHEGRTEHLDLARDPGRDHIHLLRAAPDGSLYVGLGWGLLRYREGNWQTLLELDEPHRLRTWALDIAFAGEREVWVSGPQGLARYDGQTWQEYPIAATRLAVASDGSVWAYGWNGVADSHCCLTHVIGQKWVSYPLTETVSIPAETLVSLMDAGR